MYLSMLPPPILEQQAYKVIPVSRSGFPPVIRYRQDTVKEAGKYRLPPITFFAQVGNRREKFLPARIINSTVVHTTRLNTCASSLLSPIRSAMEKRSTALTKYPVQAA